MYKYSVTQWVYGNEPLVTSLDRLQKYGYDGVELAGEPDKIDIKSTKKVLNDYDMVCSSICGIYSENRNLSSDSKVTRQKAIDYVKKNIDISAELNSKVLIVVPSSVGKTEPDSSYENAWNFALESFNIVADYASKSNIHIAVEALNRYETFLINNLTLAKKFVELINQPSVGIMADLFHMNIEERNIVESLFMIKDHLNHVHFADNTREGVGVGSTNFKPVLETLTEIEYKDFIAMEFLPRVSNPYLQSSVTGENKIYDEYTKISIEKSKSIENEILLR